MSLLQEFLLRWRDAGGNPRDLQVTDASDGGYRLSTREKGELSATEGSALSVSSGATEDIINKTMTGDTFISGFYVWGETDALFELSINGILFKKRINYLERESFIWFKKPIYMSIGQIATLTVTNNNADLKDFGGTLFEAI